MKYSYYKSIISLNIILILSSCNVKDNSNNNDNTKTDSVNVESTEFAKVNTTFNYNGDPINPLFLYEITENELASENNAVVSIDVTYASTLKKYKDFGNQNNLSEGEEFRSFESKENSTYSTTWRKVLESYDDGSYSYDLGSFSYTWYGKLNNGIHVLKTISNGGGTMSVVNLLCVRFSEQDYYKGGAKEQRVFLTKLSEEMLGMPKELNIMLDKEKNNVTIHYKDGNNYDKDINKIIQF